MSLTSRAVSSVSIRLGMPCWEIIYPIKESCKLLHIPRDAHHRWHPTSKNLDIENEKIGNFISILPILPNVFSTALAFSCRWRSVTCIKWQNRKFRLEALALNRNLRLPQRRCAVNFSLTITVNLTASCSGLVRLLLCTVLLPAVLQSNQIGIFSSLGRNSVISGT